MLGETSKNGIFTIAVDSRYHGRKTIPFEKKRIQVWSCETTSPKQNEHFSTWNPAPLKNGTTDVGGRKTRWKKQFFLYGTLMHVDGLHRNRWARALKRDNKNQHHGFGDISGHLLYALHKTCGKKTICKCFNQESTIFSAWWADWKILPSTVFSTVYVCQGDGHLIFNAQTLNVCYTSKHLSRRYLNP